MADKKISALTAATTPLAGTEVLPIVQGGATVKVSVDNLTAGKPVTASQLTVENNTSSAALRVTQTGSGNALVVEDDANPDASPFVVDNGGNVAVGKATASTKLDVTNGGASGDTLWVTGGGSTQARFIHSSSTGLVAIGARSSTSSMIGAFRTDAPFVADLVLNPDGGNVGVGVTPAHKLDVNGSLRLSEFSDILVNTTGAGSLALVAGSTYNAGGTIVLRGSSNSTNPYGMEFNTGGVTRVTIGTAGDLAVNTGNLVLGTAGKGIDFSANTGAPGMTSELLDWYEEGTWSPTYTFDVNPTTPITMNVTSATYTRVGRQVSVRAFIATNGVNLTGASGTFYISGLPFPAGTDEYSAVAMSFCRNWAGNYPSAGYVNGAVITMEYRATANGSTSLMTTADLSTSAGSNQNQIMIFASYFV